MKRGNYENRRIKLGDGVYYGGGHIHVTDEKGSYSIPVGRKARRTLCVLGEKPGYYKRCIEIDLITGKIYLNVDHEDSARDVYYYDMASEKLWNARLIRLLAQAARSGMVLEDNLRKVIVKLPNKDWREMIETLPGWTEAIEHRLDNLLLPQGEVEVIRWSDAEHAPEPGEAPGADADTDPVRDALGSGFRLQKKDGVWQLHYADLTAGGEFFGSSDEYLRILSDAERDWVLYVVRSESPEEAKEKILRFLRREIEVQ